MLEKEYRTYLKLEKGLSPNSVDAYLMDYQRLKEYADKHGIDVVHASFDDLQAFVFDTFKEIGLDKKSGGSVDTEEFELFMSHITKKHQIKKRQHWLKEKINQISFWVWI